MLIISKLPDYLFITKPSERRRLFMASLGIYTIRRINAILARVVQGIWEDHIDVYARKIVFNPSTTSKKENRNL